jgi:hypothetical protein
MEENLFNVSTAHIIPQLGIKGKIISAVFRKYSLLESLVLCKVLVLYIHPHRQGNIQAVAAVPRLRRGNI